jgi:hypothetical protein
MSASLWLDHLIIAVHDLAQAVVAYRALGFTVIPGGRHANQATENALICFRDGSYIELLARTGEPPLPGMIDFSRSMGASEGLAGFALGTVDIDAAAAALGERGVACGEIVSGQRQRTDGIHIVWKLALIEDGFAPFLIQDVTPHNLRVPDAPAITTHDNGAVRLRAIEMTSRAPARAAQRLEAILGKPSLSNADDSYVIRMDSFAIDIRPASTERPDETIADSALCGAIIESELHTPSHTDCGLAHGLRFTFQHSQGLST